MVVHPGTHGWWWSSGAAAPRPLGGEDHEGRPGRSALRGGAQVVEYVEHVLAAAVILDLDAVRFHFEGPEAPWLDGSAWPWVLAFREAGLSPCPPPSKVSIRMSFGDQDLLWRSGDLRPARARSPALASTVSSSVARAGFPGVTPSAVCRCDDQLRPLGGDRPRLLDEARWHKILDLLGDLAPRRASGPIHADLEVPRGTHTSHKKLLADAFRAAAARGITADRPFAPGAP